MVIGEEEMSHAGGAVIFHVDDVDEFYKRNRCGAFSRRRTRRPLG